MITLAFRKLFIVLLFAGLLQMPALAQNAPSANEVTGYSGLFKAVLEQDVTVITQAIQGSSNIDLRDSYGRTALHVATYAGNQVAMKLLVKAGADPNALEHDRYDMVTIAAVANDLSTMQLAIKLGNKPGNMTSPYDGTALIAAAHLGHVEVVKTLIHSGAALDHINNLEWTALIESIVLGDGGARHTTVLKALVDAGANVNLADGRGDTPLTLARQRGYTNMVDILKKAGAK
ncbi:MAG: ankyrin repeat protein [Gammaproteobacteria bacterium]|jgi:ankyrin repeat protein